MEIKHSSKEEAVSAGSKLLQETLESLSGTPVLFLSSGGSSLRLLENLSLPEGLKITLGSLDERYTFISEESNYSGLLETDFAKAVLSNGNGIDSRPEDGESLEDAALQFEQALKVWRLQNPSGKIIATLGVGADGHTAGIFPFPDQEENFEKAFNHPEKWVFGYEVDPSVNQYTARLTTTLTFLKDEIDVGIGLMLGEEKNEAFLKLNDEKGSLHETPSRIFHEMKDVTLFTDLD